MPKNFLNFFEKTLDKKTGLCYTLDVRKREKEPYKKGRKKMKVYIVKMNGSIWGVYATKEAAEAAKKEANLDAEMGGTWGGYMVKEYEVEA